MIKQKFIPFHWESSVYWGIIDNTEDLKKLFALYEGTYTKKEILTKARARVLDVLGEDYQSYGLKVDYTGRTLEQFLIEQGVTI